MDSLSPAVGIATKVHTMDYRSRSAYNSRSDYRSRSAVDNLDPVSALKQEPCHIVATDPTGQMLAQELRYADHPRIFFLAEELCHTDHTGKTEPRSCRPDIPVNKRIYLL